MVEAVLKEISKSSKNIESSNRQFREAANENNRSVNKAVKDIASSFISQRKQSADLSNSISESISQAQQSASKIDSTNSLLQESISLQGSMVNELKNIRLGIRSLADSISQSGSLGGAGTGGMASKLGMSPAKAAMFRLGGAGLVGTGANMVGNIGTIPSATPFAGTEEQKVELIRKTIRDKESPGSYSKPSFAEGKGSSASGGYQFTDSTWKTQAKKIGVDTEMFPRAMMAPPEIQDAVAKNYIKEILVKVKGDVSKVPNVWYTGNPEGKMSGQALAVNRGLTAESYQASWMQKYNKNVAASGFQGDASKVDTTPSNTSQQSTGEPTSSGENAGASSGGDKGHAEALSKGVNSGIASKLKEIESAFGPGLSITSGRRDEAKNASVGGAGSSAHLRGNAVDVKFNGGIQETLKLIEAASKAGIGGIGVYGPGSVHLDTESRRSWGSNFKRESVPRWAEGAVRAHETGKWGEYDASARGGEGDASRVGGGGMIGSGLGGMMGGGMMGGGYGGMGMSSNPMAMMGMGGGRFGVIASAIGALAPAIGGMIGGMRSSDRSSPEPQQGVVGSEAGKLFDFKQLAELSPEDQTSAKFFEADRNERLRKSQTIQQRATENTAQEQTAQQKLAEAPMPPPRPADAGSQTVVNNTSAPQSSLSTIDDWARRLASRFNIDYPIA
jgi:hypothetical protein